MLNIGLSALQTIKGLDMPNTMSEKKLAEFNYELDMFIETFPGKSYELTKLFIVKDYEFLIKKLYELRVVLGRVYASVMIEKCGDLIEIVKQGDKQAIDVLLGRFISELSTLSIDAQLAGHRSLEKPQHHAAAPSHTRKNILVVDDEPVILNAMKKIIESEKYKFSGMASSKAALRYLEGHPLPDLFIFDIDMPEMNGYELAESVIAKGYDIPIVFLTSNATREYVMRAIQIGVSDFLVKPADEGLILDRLEQYLG